MDGAAEAGVDRRVPSAKGDGAGEKEGGEKCEERLHWQREQPGGRELDGEDGGGGEVKRPPIRTNRVGAVSGAGVRSGWS